jgi:hypothetical protein
MEVNMEPPATHVQLQGLIDDTVSQKQQNFPLKSNRFEPLPKRQTIPTGARQNNLAHQQKRNPQEAADTPPFAPTLQTPAHQVSRTANPIPNQMGRNTAITTRSKLPVGNLPGDQAMLQLSLLS